MTRALDRIINQPAAPAPVTPPVSASSTDGSPLGGALPIVPPEQQGYVSDMLKGLVYSLPAGGYISSLNPWTGRPPSMEEVNNPNSAYNKFGPLNANAYTQKYGVSDPAANQRAAALYSYLGTLPTRNVGTAALEKLYTRQGITPSLQPSYNERTQQAGLGTTWGGPWATPSWHPGVSEEDWRYMHPPSGR